MHVYEEVSLPSLSKFKIFDTLFVRIVYDLVVNIRDIHAQLNVVAEVVSKNSPNHVVAKIVSGMSHVTVGVYRRATRIPFNILGVSGDESLELVGKTVFEFKTCAKIGFHSK